MPYTINTTGVNYVVRGLPSVVWCGAKAKLHRTTPHYTIYTV